MRWSPTTIGTAPRARRSTRCRRGGRRLPGRVHERRLARGGGLPDAHRGAVRARAVELRGLRHEARAVGEAGIRSPALLLRRAGRAGSGKGAGADSRRARERGDCGLPGRGVRGLLPAGSTKSWWSWSRASASVSVDYDFRDLRRQACFTTWWDSPLYHLTRFALSLKDLGRSRTGINAETYAKIHEPPRASAVGHGAIQGVTASSSSSRSPMRGSRCCRRPRRATSSSTSRATRSGTGTGASSISGASSTPSATTRRSGPTTTPPSARRSRPSSTSSTSSSPPTRRCTSTTTPPTRSPR